MKNLESFVKQNRGLFDSKVPKESLWDRIEGELDGQQPVKKVFSVWNKWSIAASIVALLSVGYMAGKYASPMASTSDIMAISPSYAAELVSYNSMIVERKEELERRANAKPGMLIAFENDLQELQDGYLNLRAELPNNPNQEMILQEMRNNLQWQLELLERQGELVDKVQQRDREIAVLTQSAGNKLK